MNGTIRSPSLLNKSPLTHCRAHELAIGRTAFDVDPDMNPFQSSPRSPSSGNPALKPAAGVRVGAGHLADCSDTMRDIAR